MQTQIQDFIHRLEEGGGNRFSRIMLAVIAALALAVLYNAACFRNLSTIEGMDTAQLARNLSEGRGFSTLFVRPFSIHLIETHRADHDPLLKDQHPDISNAPLYPLVLAAALKLLPFDYPDTTLPKSFSISLPELGIAIFNQILFFVLVWLVYRLARKLFDERVGWISAAVLLGAEVFWRFSISGLSTIFLALIVTGLTHVLVSVETLLRVPITSGKRLALLSAGAGLLVGLACLTRYSFAWLILPLILWLTLVGGKYRAVMIVTCAGVFLATISPWVARNVLICGSPFGTAGYAIVQNTSQFSDYQLERSLSPRFVDFGVADIGRKFVTGAREMASNQLPKFGGSWISAFFLVGLLVRFKNPTLTRLRWWLVLSIITLFIAQALARTSPSGESSDISTDNLLVALAPVVFIYGVSLVFILIDQMGESSASTKWSLTGAFVLLCSLPLVLSLLTPVTTRDAYPPYFPPWIEGKSRYIADKGLIMSDIPWAIAWYGRRQAVWLSQDYHQETGNEDFAAIYRRKPVNALYLSLWSLKSMDFQALLQWAQHSNQEDKWTKWEDFVFSTYFKQEVPTGFPLRSAPEPLVPEIFLKDVEREAKKTIKTP